jgi:hypothetical protein
MMPPGTRFSAHLTGVEVHKVTVEGIDAMGMPRIYGIYDPG